MSYLTYPQINFKGTAYCNPSTADNNDLADVFDIDTLQLKPTMTVIPGGEVQQPAGEQQFNYTGIGSAGDCRAWLMGLLENSGEGPKPEYGQQAHWNYYGDHATRLDGTKISSLIASDGTQWPSSDPLYAATVSLIGTPSPMQFQDPVIVDNDPYALITSQVFSHGVNITAPDGTLLMSASPATRSYAYYINVHKNLDPNAIGFQGVSAIFLLSIPKGPNLTFNLNANSPALADLAQAVENGAGIQLRFIFYNAIYQISPEDLYQFFQQKIYKPNPYIGLTLGTIGVLGQKDMLSAPPGRKLNVQSAPFYYNVSSPCTPCAAPPSSDPNIKSAALGVTQALIDPATESVYLDCVSTFPECNVGTNAKFNFGQQPQNLVLTPVGGSSIVVGAIPNTQAQYEANAGMVAIPLGNNPDKAAILASANSGTLTIVDANSGNTLLSESAGLDFQTEDRALYFDAQTIHDWDDATEQPVPGTSKITIRAYRRGLPVQDEVKVNLEYWMCAKDQVNPSKPQVPVPSPYFTVSGAVAQQPTVYANAPGNPPNISVLTDQVTIPANSNGELTITLTAVRSGTSIIRFLDPTIPPVPPNFCWDNADYSCIRILPFDDYRAYSDDEINNWQFMYENFFNYFALLYPVMSHVIPWGPTDAPNNPDIVAQFASQMKIFTDPANWDTTIYMPITRDLSAGKRALLWRWCNLQGA